MGTWERLVRAGRGLWRRDAPAGAPPEASRANEPAPEPAPGAVEPRAPGGAPASEQLPRPARGLSGWVEERAARAVARAYEGRAADLEERARRAVSSAYEHSADDMEERAVRAMRQALASEAERIRQAIEHGIAVKKREVRLSLLVLVVSSFVYLGLYWFTRQGTQ